MYSTLPCGNSTGSWILWKMNTRVRVRRTNFQKLVTSELVINQMNALAQEYEEEMLHPGMQIPEQQSTEEEKETEDLEGNPEVNLEELPEAALEGGGTGDNRNETEAENERTEEVIDETAVKTRSGRVIQRPSRFLGVTKVSRSEWKEMACEQAIKAELRQLFDELKALCVIKRAEVTRSAKVLKSHMFLVRKYLADGSFDKVKARLVADGRDQDAELYPNKSSPTVAIHSVFTVLGLAATKAWRIVVKIDVKGAFVQPPMSGEPTFMRLDPKVSKYAMELFPNLKSMVEEDGCLYTVLLKAMYGCVQASALWYSMIRAELEKLGYSVGPTDPCVFVKQVGDRIYILLLYVDDILAIVDKEEAEKIQAHLVAKFVSVQFEEGGRLSYLGMEIDVTVAGTSVDMSFYVKQLLEDAKERMNLVVYASPGTKETFVSNEEEKRLPVKN